MGETSVQARPRPTSPSDWFGSFPARARIMRRIGLYLGRLPGFDKSGLDRRDLIDCVRAAEACGYESFWMPESWERDAFSLLAELAAATERIGLGTGIVNVFSRSPALLAMSAATLDEMSGGRFSLGLGTSGARVIEDFHGYAYDRPLTRLKETVEIVRSLIAGERVDYDGECFKLARFKLGFKPLRAEIPIYIAALSPKSLRQVGEIADGWLPAYWPFGRLAEGITLIEAGAKSAGRDPKAIEVAPMINLFVADNVREARDAARLPLAYYIGGMGGYYHAMASRMGFKAEADLIRELWRSGKPRRAIGAATDRLVDGLAVCGPADYCRARLDEIRADGATLPLVSVPAEGTTAMKISRIESMIT